MGRDRKPKPFALGDEGYDAARQQATRFFRSSSTAQPAARGAAAGGSMSEQDIAAAKAQRDKLHTTTKDGVKTEAHTWHAMKMSKYGRMRQLIVNPISDHLYRDSTRELMSMPKLRNLAPSWLQTALKRIDTPLTGGSDLTEWRPEGRTLIRKGWDQFYLDRIFVEGTLAQAKKDHDDRHARRLGDQAARAAVQAVAAGSSQTQAAAAAVAAMSSVASGQADQYSGFSPEVQVEKFGGCYLVAIIFLLIDLVGFVENDSRSTPQKMYPSRSRLFL